jgi:hypothetical protein
MRWVQIRPIRLITIEHTLKIRISDPEVYKQAVLYNAKSEGLPYAYDPKKNVIVVWGKNTTYKFKVYRSEISGRYFVDITRMHVLRVIRAKYRGRIEVGSFEEFKRELRDAEVTLSEGAAWGENEVIMDLRGVKVKHTTVVIKFNPHEEGGKKYVDLEIEVETPRRSFPLVKNIVESMVNMLGKVKQENEENEEDSQGETTN